MNNFTITIACNKCGSVDVNTESEEVYIEHEFAYIKTIYKCSCCGNTEIKER